MNALPVGTLDDIVLLLLYVFCVWIQRHDCGFLTCREAGAKAAAEPARASRVKVCMVKCVIIVDL